MRPVRSWRHKNDVSIINFNLRKKEKNNLKGGRGVFADKPKSDSDGEESIRH